MRHFSKARQSVSPEFGRSLAASALAFLAADPERLNRFLSLTGLGPHNLRDAAEDPAFRGSVLEYMLADEELRTIPVVAVTAFAMKGDEEKIRQGGCEAYLSKPISVSRFFDTIDQFLGPGVKQ